MSLSLNKMSETELERKLESVSTSSDLSLDSGTFYIDVSENRCGIGNTAPGAQLDVHDTTTSSANTGGHIRLSANDGAAMGDSHRLGVIEFTGAEDTAGTQTVAARIEALTEAAWTNAENGGALYFYTTDGNASQTNVLKLDSNKKATFAGEVLINGDLKVTDSTDTATLTWQSGVFELRDSNAGSTVDVLRAYYTGSVPRLLTGTVTASIIEGGSITGSGSSSTLELTSGASAAITLDAGTDIQLEPGGNDIIVVPDGSTESFRFTANGATSATWDVVGNAIIDADGGSFTFSDGGSTLLSINSDAEISTAVPSKATTGTPDILYGAGVSNVITSAYRSVLNGCITTILNIDLGAGTNIGAAADKYDAIGNTGGGNAYLAKFTTASFGYVTGISMTCVEVPNAASGTLQAGIGLVAYDTAVAYDGDVATGNYLVMLNPASYGGGSANAEDWGLGDTKSNKYDSMDGTVDYYLYLANIDSSINSCVYDAGKFTIKIYSTAHW